MSPLPSALNKQMHQIGDDYENKSRKDKPFLSTSASAWQSSTLLISNLDAVTGITRCPF